MTQFEGPFMENKSLNCGYVNEAFRRKRSIFYFRCSPLFLCHISITAGLFFKFGRRTERSHVAIECFLFWFLSFQEDTNFISHSEIRVLRTSFWMVNVVLKSASFAGQVCRSWTPLTVSYFNVLWRQNSRCCVYINSGHTIEEQPLTRVYLKYCAVQKCTLGFLC